MPDRHGIADRLAVRLHNPEGGNECDQHRDGSIFMSPFCRVIELDRQTALP